MLTVIINWPSTVRRFILRVNSCVFIHNPQNVFLQGRTIVCEKNYFVIFKIIYSFYMNDILVEDVDSDTEKWLPVEPRCNWKRSTKGGCYPCEPSLISINIIQMIYSASSNNILVSYSRYLTDLRLHVIFLPRSLNYVRNYAAHKYNQYLYLIFLTHFFRQLCYN